MQERVGGLGQVFMSDSSTPGTGKRIAKEDTWGLSETAILEGGEDVKLSGIRERVGQGGSRV